MDAKLDFIDSCNYDGSERTRITGNTDVSVCKWLYMGVLKGFSHVMRQNFHAVTI